MTKVPQWLWGALFAGMVLQSWHTLGYPPVQVVSVDLHRIKGQLIAQLAHHGASPQQVTEVHARFTHHLPQVLAQYAHTHHVVMVSQHVALAGAKDITHEITPLLAVAMGGES